MRQAGRWGDGWFLGACVTLALLLRFPAALRPLGPDESGFLLVSRSVAPRPDSLYGPLFLDRPPPLVGVFRAADELAGTYGPRVVTAVLVVAVVPVAYRCGRLLGGRGPARLAALAAVALTGRPDLTLWQAKSESLGVPWLVVSWWLALEALHAGRPRPRLALAAGAGLAAGLALGMKQNLAGGVCFGLLLLGVAARTGRLPGKDAAGAAAAVLLGACVVPLGSIAWGLGAGVSPQVFWSDLLAFRAEALGVVVQGDLGPTSGRLARLALLAVSTGLVVLLAALLVTARTTRRQHPEAVAAVLVTALLDGVGILLSGSYWPSNLAVLLPAGLLAVVLLSTAGGVRTRAATGAVVWVSLLVTAAAATVWAQRELTGRTPAVAVHVGEAVRASAQQGDSVTALYGRADVVLATGLRPAYRHLWALPARVLDGDGALLQRLLSSPQAPTWVVLMADVDAWDLDEDGQVAATLRTRYARAGAVCGRSVLLLRSEQRPPLPQVDCRARWR